MRYARSERMSRLRTLTQSHSTIKYGGPFFPTRLSPGSLVFLLSPRPTWCARRCSSRCRGWCRRLLGGAGAERARTFRGARRGARAHPGRPAAMLRSRSRHRSCGPDKRGQHRKKLGENKFCCTLNNMGVDSRAASAAKIWRLACASTLTVRSFDFDTRIVMYNLSARFMLVSDSCSRTWPA